MIAVTIVLGICLGLARAAKACGYPTDMRTGDLAVAFAGLLWLHAISMRLRRKAGG